MSDWRTKYDERTGKSRPVTDLLTRQAEEAYERYERGVKALYRGDGTKLYADAEHAERENALKAARDRELDEAWS